MSAPALVRQSTSELESALQEKLAEADEIRAAIAEKSEGDKRAADEAEASDAEEETEQKEEGAEPAAKQVQDVDAGGASDVETDSDEEGSDEETIADGTTVAVAYGNLDGLSKRKWYAATIVAFNKGSGLYTVKWKFPPRGRKKVFDVDPLKLKVVSQEDYENAPKRGNHMCLHRASTFVAPSKAGDAMEEDEEEASDEDEDPMVGAHVAVAYGTARANASGRDPTKGKDPAKYKKRYLWYAATITKDNEEDGTYEVEWKYPVSQKTATFVVPKDKVQVITKKEFKRAKKASRGKTTYGLVGVHRVATKAKLTVG